VAVLTIFLMGIVYCLAAPGRARSCTKAAVAAVVAVFGLARLYLGVDHPGDLLLGATFAAAIAVTAFRYFTPNEVFPVAYRRGRTAHVDVTGRRGMAIRQAMRDQLGLHVIEIRPVGLASSAGSTPLRLRVQGGPEQFVFAKLYTRGHVRADRWYKLWRTVLYGSLEDEVPFKSVRRLVTYEDYVLRLLDDIGPNRPLRPGGHARSNARSAWRPNSPASLSHLPGGPVLGSSRTGRPVACLASRAVNCETSGPGAQRSRAAASTTSTLSNPVPPRLPRVAVRPRGAPLLLHLLLQCRHAKGPLPLGKGP
jgi:hypothetical protein